MQAKDNEIEPKRKEIESEKTTPKESTDLTDEEVLDLHRKMFLETPGIDKPFDLSVKGILDDTEVSPETSDNRLFPPPKLSPRAADFYSGKDPGDFKL